VVQNLRGVGTETFLASLCGKDADGKYLRGALKKIGCRTEGLIASAARPTTSKTRIMARRQQVVRVDSEVTNDMNGREAAALWKCVAEFLSTVKGVIISDYAKGVVSQPFIGRLLKACKKQGLFVAIDPKERHFDLYEGVSVMTPNLKEAHVALGVPYAHCSDSDVKALGWKLVNKYGLRYLLITLSERGMALFEREEKVFTHLPTVAQKVFDVTGAGDTVISVYSAAITCKASPLEAAFLANHAAGLAVAQVGTAYVDPQSLLKACRAGLSA
jgi:D-beta-D-heptose 7-phosphate kinase/D-beta-D-heptose 1-phosphate adenosyltransferase